MTANDADSQEQKSAMGARGVEVQPTVWVGAANEHVLVSLSSVERKLLTHVFREPSFGDFLSLERFA